MQLYGVATKDVENQEVKVHTAELIREVGLKCIGFNGVSLSSLSSFVLFSQRLIMEHYSHLP